MTDSPRTKPVYTPPGGPPKFDLPPPEILRSIGEDGVFALLADFYVRLEKTELRPLFPEDMPAASERSAAFFVQVMGGRPLYVERYGPPRMRLRHVPFEIDEQARGVWLAAFEEAIEEAVKEREFPEKYAQGFRTFLMEFSSWMVNVAPDDAD